MAVIVKECIDEDINEDLKIIQKIIVEQENLKKLYDIEKSKVYQEN
jgi:hypothetical protein